MFFCFPIKIQERSSYLLLSDFYRMVTFMIFIPLCKSYIKFNNTQMFFSYRSFSTTMEVSIRRKPIPLIYLRKKQIFYKLWYVLSLEVSH